MNAGVRVICPPALQGGFVLAGLACVPATLADAEAVLRRLAGQTDVGVILMEETLHDALPPELHRQLIRRPTPMVVPFPGPRWGEAGEGPEAYVVELLRQVIGYRVRLR